jgi:hypothetical protein
MPCAICGKAIDSGSKYCDRHRKLFSGKKELAATVAAAKEAWSKLEDAYICRYTGAKLDETDPSDEWYITFDHMVPGKPGKLVACARWVNEMKTDLLFGEFRKAIRGVNTFHLTGVPFDKGSIGCGHWSRAVDSSARRGLAGLLRKGERTLKADCPVCGGRTGPGYIYCKRCMGLIRNHPEHVAHAAALKKGWDAARHVFVCHYSGIVLDEKDCHGPFYLTFDHTIPGQRGKLVLAAYLFNEMKCSLTEDAFWAVVKELVRHWEEGTPFDRSVAKFSNRGGK